MWRSWSKSSSSSSSSPRIPPQSPSSKDNNNNNNKSKPFRCSSFKDIENLCLDDNNHFSPSISKHKHRPPSPQHQQRRSVFHRVRSANAFLRQSPRSDSDEARIVVYYTSLRVVRPTFEACRAVHSIFQGFRVAIDERDLAMDSGFMTELRDLLGMKPHETLTLPRVFIGGRYIGGAEEVKNLHEVGDLKALISGLPIAKPGTCNTCGGYRFILCTQCSGSRKVFSDKLGFRTCSGCNENGLIRCPHCSSPPPSILAPLTLNASS